MSRFAPLNLRSGKTLGNRVVVPPMASQTSNSEGFVTPKTLEHYTRLGQASAGLLFVEYSFVHRSGRSEANQLGVHDDGLIPGLTKLAEAIQSSGALAGIQITHAGGKTTKDLTGGVLLGPGEVPVPAKDRQFDRPTPMSNEDIRTWKRSFVDAARRASIAGFDIVELHSAHGYGLNQWLSPLTNLRTDAYGGDLHGRSRLLLEIIEEIRNLFPDLLLSVRIPGQDFLQGGLSLQDTQKLSQKLELSGVDFIHVSSGIGGWQRPDSRTGEGYLVEESTQIQAVVKTPVIGVGGIKTGAFIDHGLIQGWFSLATVGRAILENPREWGKKHLSCEEKNAFVR